VELHLLERIFAGIASIVVGAFALAGLVGEWKKTGLDDHVTKVMMVLLTIGCVLVILVAAGLIGRV